MGLADAVDSAHGFDHLPQRDLLRSLSLGLRSNLLDKPIIPQDPCVSRALMNLLPMSFSEALRNESGITATRLSQTGTELAQDPIHRHPLQVLLAHIRS